LRDKHPADAVGLEMPGAGGKRLWRAMGGVPRCFLLSLALPKDLAGRGWMSFWRGCGGAARRFGCVLAGGDTTERREILINVTVVGEVRSGRGLRRSGTRVGDGLYISGRLGEAELGLRLLTGRKRVSLRDARVRKHLYPEPRVELGRWLGEEASGDSNDGSVGWAVERFNADV